MSTDSHAHPLWPLTGRDDQVRRYRECLAGSRYVVYVIHGEVGAGKTRLAEECVEIAAEEGYLCSRAVAGAAARAIPLGAIAHLLPSGIDVSNPVSVFDKTVQHLSVQKGKRARAVWFIDDLHLLDATSMTLLGQLMDAGLIFLLGTLPSGKAQAEALEGLERGDRGARIDLQAWSLAEVETVLHAGLGGPVEKGTTNYLHGTSGGNPLYLRELVRGALDSAVLTGEGGVWRLVGPVKGTARLAEIIHARIRAVCRAGRAAMERIAVCGAIGADEIDPEVIARLEELDVVRVVADRGRLVADLTHPLYREVLRSAMGRTQTRRVLLESIEHLEGYGARRREDRLRIVTWQLAATGTAKPEDLRHAVQMARHVQDFASVVRFAQALSNVDSDAGPRSLHGEALFELGCFHEADRILREAADVAHGDEELLLAVTLRARSLAWGALRVDDALEAVQHVRTKLPGAVADEWLRVVEAHLRAFAGEVTSVLDLLHDLEVMAHPRARIVGALPKAHALAEAGRTGDALALTEHTWQADLPASDAVGCFDPRMAVMVRVQVLIMAGRLTEARHLGDSAYAAVAADRSLIAQTWLALTLGRLEYTAGDLKRAEDWYATAAVLSSDNQYQGLEWLALSGLAIATAAQGNVKLSSRYSQQAQHLQPPGLQHPDAAAVIAWQLAALGNLSAARAALLKAADQANKVGALTTEALHLSSIARLGDATGVYLRLSTLAKHTDSQLVGLQAEHASALHQRCPQQLIQIARRSEEAGLLYIAAESYAQASELLMSDGQQRQATALSVQANRIAEHCGGHNITAALAPHPNPLTTREREIALLAARGLTNKEIAEQLVLSNRTVGNHLYSIYQKLGIANRRQLRTAMNDP
ncbi:LuxR C-terminal-related transcriptional regulator [Streptomyces sp. NPDC055709]